MVTTGAHAGKRGILIGETGDMRSRIKEYISGTQERGNKLWRDTFLSRGDICLYVLCLDSFMVSGRSVDPVAVLSSGNLRLVIEQLLVMQIVADANDEVWVVNARQ